MNHASHTLINQKVALDGPLTLAQLILLGAAAVLVIGFFAWRDYKASASFKILAVLLVPRLVALGVVLWMLAGPSRITYSRQFTQKSVVVLVDASASMGIVDPVDGSGSTLQWGGTKDAPAVKTLDEVLGTLCSAQSVLGRIGRNPPNQTKEAWTQIHQSITSAAGKLDRLTLDSRQADAESRAELHRVTAFLDDGLSHLAASPPDTPEAQAQRLDETASFIAGALHRIDRLAQRITASYETHPPGSGRATLAAQSKLTRQEKVLTWLDDAEDTWLKGMSTNLHLRQYKFASDVLPVPGGDWRPALTRARARETNLNLRGTDLRAALNQAVSDSAEGSVAAVVLVTDGGHNAPGDPRELAASLRGTPLFVLPIGSTAVPRDVILHHIQCPRAVFKKDSVQVEAMVTAYDCRGEQIKVQLLADDQLVDSQTLPVSSTVFDDRVSFRWNAAELGRHTLKIRALPVPREHSLDNNEAQTEIEVMEDTIHVLLADDLPRWEFRYLSMLFKRDKHVQFDQLLFEPTDDSPGAQASFPQEASGWRKYQVVILGDVTPAELPPAEQESLRKYVVEDGGNLVVVAGETAMPAAFAGQPLGDMIPATSAPVDANIGLGLAVTAEGSVSVPTQLDDDPLASDRIWRDTSTQLPIYNLSPVSRPKSTSHVLINAVAPNQASDQRAFLSWQYDGLGRVVYIAAPITYQLRYGVGDLYHHRFWGQLLRWAIARDMTGGSKTVHLLTDKNRYEAGDHAQIVVRLSNADGTPLGGAQCSVEAIQHEKVVGIVELHEEAGAPGAYRGVLANLPTGQITLRAGGQTVQALLAGEGRSDPVEHQITVDIKGSGEMSNPVCNLPLLKQIADAAGGALLPPAALPNALANLNITPDEQDSVLSRRPVWKRWDLLWLFIGCMTIEWLARRYWRML